MLQLFYNANKKEQDIFNFDKNITYVSRFSSCNKILQLYHTAQINQISVISNISFQNLSIYEGIAFYKSCIYTTFYRYYFIVSLMPVFACFKCPTAESKRGVQIIHSIDSDVGDKVRKGLTGLNNQNQLQILEHTNPHQERNQHKSERIQSTKRTVVFSVAFYKFGI